MKIFLKIISLFYFIGAVLHFCDVLDLRLHFSEMTLMWKLWILFLLIGDSITFWGLWNKKKYGEVAFLIIAFAQLMAYIFFSNFFSDQLFLILFHIVCLTIYLAYKLFERGSEALLVEFNKPIDATARRILILGCCGGGKSTLAKKLGEKINLPLVHLDNHFWNPGWIATEASLWRSKVKDLANKDQWIMEGNFSDTFDIRFPLADRIIILDRPRIISLWRAIRRVFKYKKNEPRFDAAIGCHEEIHFGFYWYIWNFNKTIFPKIISALEKYNCKEKVVYLRSDKDIENFLQGL